jgi:hypothetical protein
MANGVEEPSGREIRLLLLVIVIAVAGLVVLARFRFPAADIVAVSPTPGPLERLVARAPFDDLTAAVASATEQLTPLIAVVEFDQVPAPPAKGRAAAAPAVELPRYFVPALRVRPDRWLAYQAPSTRPVRSGSGPVMVAAEDSGRGLVLLGLSGRTEPKPAVVDFTSAAAGLPASTYVIAVEAAPAGPAIRPLFLPRLDPVSAVPWDSPILRVGGTMPVAPGSLIFTLEGRFVGMIVPQQDGVAIVAAATLDRLVGELASGGQ